MNWLTNFVRPKIKALMRKEEVPDNLWTKCASCEHMLFHRDLADNLHVCHHCGYHIRISVSKRLEYLFDEGAFTKVAVPDVVTDPLKFKDTKKYTDRLKEYRSKTGNQDAVIIAYGQIGGKSAVVSAFDFSFMGGSMGMAVGEAILVASELAVKSRCALIVIPASGGARMQEGILSLMQMPRTIIAVEKVKRAGLPYVTLLTDPTTGGVSASFAMLGDVAIAEPGAIIGFAGARVIEETIRQKLPEGFQKAEYLLAHGMIDMVVPRKELNSKIGVLLSHLNG
ncbi:acetyl-CoA carboxylase, carboxyltransferase subunit beta [Candidatus Odyssella thessalonicensis]|uniref:acetyl-CoA carboxylase, carboxyltransferase subunit beta n=1 Tax=Candidatus Odyssella thessalonicensis TaxID=84647 RepID=UPI000225B90D|nr:acetyl-CoA carboxylase, carboxyltransferase subunit beta [Candidatus Odyssella thessalonicensis]